MEGGQKTEDGKSRPDMDAEGRTRQDNPEEPKNGQNRLDKVRKTLMDRLTRKQRKTAGGQIRRKEQTRPESEEKLDRRKNRNSQRARRQG